MRKQMVKEQFANSSPRRPLGFGNTGAPALMGLIDLIPGRVRLLRDSVSQNRIELRDWIDAAVIGLSGSWSNTPDYIPANTVIHIVAFIVGLANDGSEGYSSMIARSFRRAAAGDEAAIGAVTKIFEHKSNVGGDSSIEGLGSGGISIEFDSGQLVKDYTWTVKTLIVANTNA
jgi:hypothetical protein